MALIDKIDGFRVDIEVPKESIIETIEKYEKVGVKFAIVPKENSNYSFYTSRPYLAPVPEFKDFSKEK